MVKKSMDCIAAARGAIVSFRSASFINLVSAYLYIISVKRLRLLNVSQQKSWKTFIEIVLLI